MDTTKIAVVVSIVLCGAGLAVGQTEWVGHPDNPVIGSPGFPSWDHSARRLGTVLFDGSIYHMWFDSWGKIGHATSTDGVEWTMDPANPLAVNGDREDWDQAVGAPTVIHDGVRFHMWFSGSRDPFLPDTPRIGYATSPDGTTWNKYPGNPLGDLDHLSISRPSPGTVILDDGVFKMWFTSGPVFASAIGYAESTDGIHWTRYPDPVLGPGDSPGASIWEGDEVSSPTVIFDGSLYHMWYLGSRWDDRGLVGPMIGYAFSFDGIDWTRHRDNPVIPATVGQLRSMPVVFDGSTWHGWYTRAGGGVLSSTEVWYATSTCCPGVAALDRTQYIPAAAFAEGVEGSFYQTDVDLSNAGDQPVEYQLMWLPRGEDNSNPMTSATFTLGAGMSVRYANVLSEVFGLEPNSLGALAIQSTSPDLLAMSRTYNTPSSGTAGTVGQAMAAVRPDDLIQPGDRRRLLFGTQNGKMRTNVGCQNGTSAELSVNLELFNAQGLSMGTEVLVLQPWSNNQINRIFGTVAPTTGYVEAWTEPPDGVFFCYGSVLDNQTSDPMTVLPQ